jgi:hypothetical protein
MTGPSGVMALVLAETAAGATAILFLTPLWSEVRRGFFYLTGILVALLAAGAAGAAAGSYAPARAVPGRWAVWLAVALGGTTVAWMALMRLRAASPARVLGFVTVPLSVAMLWAFAHLSAEGTAVSFVQLVAGALFTGAVLDGLLLGHWYLTDRRLTRGPINRMAWLLIGAVAVQVIALVVGGFGGNEPGSAATETLNPILTLAGSATLIAIGMTLATGLIAVFIRLILRGQRPTAVQAATGFFYLAVITAFTGELAAKIRFLP